LLACATGHPALDAIQQPVIDPQEIVLDDNPWSEGSIAADWQGWICSPSLAIEHKLELVSTGLQTRQSLLQR
jgi:hypothetical protein